jgi:hypothetical protein
MVDQPYAVSALNSNVPPSIMPSMSQRPIAGCSSNLVSIVSQSATQQAGGLIQINVPNQPNTYIKTGSSFLKMQVAVTITGTAGAEAVITGGNASGNWASLLLRATMSAGANILEQINQYSYFDELLNLHAGSVGYYQQNMQELYGQKITVANGAQNTTYKITVCIPVSFGLLNNCEELHFPLGLLNSGLQLIFDLQGDMNQAIYVPAVIGAGVTGVTYAVSSISFNYEAIKVPTEHFQSLRAEMAQTGSLYQIPYVSALNMSIASQATTDMTFGVGLSSLKGVFSTLKPASAFKTQYLSKRAGMTQWRALLDGQMVNQYSLPLINDSYNSDVEYYVDLNRALGILGSTNRNSGANDLVGNLPALAGTANTTSGYVAKYFWTGLCTNKFSEHGLCYTGTAVSQLQIHGETIDTGAVNTMYLILIYDSALFVNSQGDCSVNR